MENDQSGANLSENVIVSDRLSECDVKSDSGISEGRNLVGDIATSSSSTSDTSYLTLTEEILNMTKIPELEDAVEKCKVMAMERPDDSVEKKHLIRRLIELRLRLHDIKEAVRDEIPVINTIKDKRLVLGHHFIQQNHPNSFTTHYCDRCSGVIWNAIHIWHLCSDCDYKCHTWCLNQVCRVCAYVVVTESKSYELEICPEAADGLAGQNYRCEECLNRTSYTGSHGMLGFATTALQTAGVPALEPRRCDYNGKYYCPTCHWNSTAIIPARVINNWDFTERRVCRQSKQQLRLLSRFPIIPLELLNPVLFASVDELKAVKDHRQRILFMKKYLTSCKTALEANLTWKLHDRLHFWENNGRYSLQDLIDLKAGTLLPSLQSPMEIFEKHITKDCQICKGKGFICEICKEDNVIYPFEPEIMCCPVCATAFHLPCWLSNLQSCPKCVRKQQRESNLAKEVL